MMLILSFENYWTLWLLFVYSIYMSYWVSTVMSSVVSLQCYPALTPVTAVTFHKDWLIYGMFICTNLYQVHCSFLYRPQSGWRNSVSGSPVYLSVHHNLFVWFRINGESKLGLLWTLHMCTTQYCLTLWCPMLLYSYSYKASCARPG